MQPLVTIVIPLYNGSNYIEQALQCALAQDYPHKEILVVNDGSRDEGAGREICLKYRDRITYLEKPNGGCSSALNYGIRAAQGSYISWLSHDDLYVPNKLSHQVKLLEKAGDGETVICNRGTLIDAQGNQLMYPTARENMVLDGLGFFKYLLFNKCVNGCSLLIPKSIFEKGLYFDESMRFVLDWNLWLKMAASGTGLYLDDAILVKNRVHGGQVTVKQKELHQVEAERTVEDLFQFLQDKPVVFMKELFYFAYATRKTGTEKIRNWLQQRGEKINLLRANSMRLKIEFKRLAKRIYHAIRK